MPKISSVSIIRWYRKNKRELPWRRVKDPYITWISEIMLQQTQVAAVTSYFEKFISRFPNVSQLAKASETDVLKHWQGLGYYCRARNLHRGAMLVQSKYFGHFPSTLENLLEIPGIGRYTAGAIMSIAFQKPAPIVDGNIKRVFARYYGMTSRIDSPSANAFFWKQATRWVTACDNPSDLNQGLMELGATVCQRQPRCEQCPLKQDCIARLKGLTSEIPKIAKRRATITLRWLSIVYAAGSSVYLEKNVQKRWWKGLWDLPRIEFSTSRDLEKALENILESRQGSITPLPSIEHTVTHHQIKVYPYKLFLKKRFLPAPLGSWFPMNRIPPTSALVQKILCTV